MWFMYNAMHFETDTKQFQKATKGFYVNLLKIKTQINETVRSRSRQINGAQKS